MNEVADIAVIGMAVMGRNLALNMAQRGFQVALHNRTARVTDQVLAEAGALRANLSGHEDLPGLVAALRRPRSIMLMVKAGEAVDHAITALRPLLDVGDIIIDGGNADFRDTRHRAAALAGTGLRFLGTGVSGGEEGARHGPAIMAGGDAQAYEQVAPIFSAIAARAGTASCAAWLGPDGAGHFVKTLHNGIEYADMQMIAEIALILRRGLGLSAARVSEIFARWDQGPLRSYLIEITGRIFAIDDPDTGRPLIDLILDTAGEKGTGRWAAMAALELGVPAPTIGEAVAARGLSALKAERLAAANRLPAPRSPVATTIEALEAALLAGKICAYAQGFAVLKAASDQWGWSLPLSRIARIWRAGCIIRSDFLDRIATAWEQAPDLPNLMVAPDFAQTLLGHQHAFRDVVSAAAGGGVPVPALSSALAYFEGYRTSRLWADLIQAQRDYFGAHTFERIDRPGAVHFDWAGASAP